MKQKKLEAMQLLCILLVNGKIHLASQYTYDLQFTNYQSYLCTKHNMISYSFILENNFKKLYTDSDSLLLSFEKQDLVTDLRNLQLKYNMFDFSILENKLELYDKTNNKDLGKFKMVTPVSLGIDELLH